MRTHVTSKIVLATSLAVALIATYLAFSAWRLDKERTDYAISGYLRIVSDVIRSSAAIQGSDGLRSVRDSINAALPATVTVSSIFVYGTAHRTVGGIGRNLDNVPNDADTQSDDSLLFDPESWISPAPSSISSSSPLMWSTYADDYAPANAVVTIDSSDWKRTDGIEIMGILKGLLVLSVILIAVLRGLVYGWVSRPAAAIIRVAHRIAAGDLDLRLAVGDRDEFGKIMIAFNDLTDALLRTQQQADTDGLTQLFNHRYLQEKLAESVETARKSGGSMAVILIDLNRFKLLNDTYGHLIGDRFLQQTALVLRRAIHLDGIVGRYGGDEFLIVLPRANRERSKAAAARVRQLMEREKFRPHPISETIPISFSLGVAVFPDDGSTAHDLIAYADSTLYSEKHGGLHLVEFTREVESEFALAMASGSEASQSGLFATLFSLVVAIDKKDQYTKQHSEHVALWAARLGRATGHDDQTIRALEVAGLLHDIGKIGISDSILRKPGPLTPDEYETMKGHVAMSERLIQEIPYQEEVLAAVSCHHERWDGKGYPRGLTGPQMPVTGRIMALIDAYSAMSLDRPYRRAKTFDEIAEQIRWGAGSQFDPDLVEPFLALLAEHGNGHIHGDAVELETLEAWRLTAA